MEDRRANQKLRTRAAIVQAAARLLREGAAPTVAEAAAEAKVSRATAYRYFPTPEALLLEVAGVTPAFASVEDLVAGLKGEDTEARLTGFLKEMNAITFAEETQMRVALKVYLDTWFAGLAQGAEAPAIREGRRMRMLEQVLAPARARLSAAKWRRLQAALALTIGADAMIIMKDVCRLGDEEAQAVLIWAARAMLRAGLAED